VRIVAANLQASPLTVVYGRAGTGKTSVLRAGVVPRIGYQSVSGRPAAVVVFDTWHGDPLGGLSRAIQGTVLQVGGAEVPGREAARTLSELLDDSAEIVGAPLLIILDQFEEYFVYALDQGEQNEELATAFGRSGAHFVVALREDALARLDRFRGRAPELFDNLIEIEHLDRGQARVACVEPLRKYSEMWPGETRVDVEDELVEAVVQAVSAGSIVLGIGGAGLLDASLVQVETAYLQLVMARLWQEEARRASRVLRLSTFEALGGAERIVRGHVEDALSGLQTSDRELAAAILQHLVTPSGTRIAHTAEDLSLYVQRPEADVERVLEAMAEPGIRILRPVAAPGVSRFEIFHGVLAPAVLDFVDQERQRGIQEERRRRERRRLALILLPMVLLAAEIVFFIVRGGS
jgi:hypothetical protein